MALSPSKVDHDGLSTTPHLSAACPLLGQALVLFSLLLLGRFICGQTQSITASKGSDSSVGARSAYALRTVGGPSVWIEEGDLLEKGSV